MIAPESTSEAPMVDAAMGYAARGWPVFPLAVRGKMPMIPKREGGRGYLDATTHRGTVIEWWTRWPCANIGVATGHGFDVLDVDPKNGGDESLAALVAQHGPLPATVEASTGGGGRHVLFRPDARVRCSAGRLGHGLDVRGRGGYVVAPPSVHPSGRRYRWVVRDVPLAPWPPWLLARIVWQKPLRSEPAVATSTHIDGGGSPYGLAVLRSAVAAIQAAATTGAHRHETLRARARVVAGFVAGGELDEDLARDCLLQAWVGAGLAGRAAEAVRTIDWAFSQGMADPLAAPGRGRS